MWTKTRVQHIFLVLIVILGPVSMQGIETLIQTLNKLTSTFLAGVELTFSTEYAPIDEDVTFWCVPPRGYDLVQTRVNDSDIHAKLDMDRPVKFVVHGWLSGLYGGNRFLPFKQNLSDGWMAEMVTKWAYIENCNVCAVDWSRLANYEYGIAALVNTNLVANYMIEFMHFLELYGMDVWECAIAGHSLGGQIAGKVGRYFLGQMDAIYGMDPAGPGFTVPFDFGPGTRLSSKDARYVLCIQTSGGTFGTLVDCGHANFIMNGGLSQPGCMCALCSHFRSHEYFNEAMLAGHIFSGQKCSGRIQNFLSLALGMSCSMDWNRLGINAERKPGRYFVKTNRKAPYAQIVIDVGTSSVSVGRM